MGISGITLYLLVGCLICILIQALHWYSVFWLRQPILQSDFKTKMAQIAQSNIGLETSNQHMDISDKRDGPIPIAVQEKTKNTSHLKTDIKKQIHFSIIVCYHQKPDDITSAIHWVLEQDYPYFELILVNDGDSTIFSKVEEEFLTRYSEKIKYIFHSKQNMGKRGALARGIAEAQNPYLVFTDIDCIPPSTWLSTIALHIQPHIQVILGVSPYLKNKQFLNQIVQHETFLTAVQYLGWAQRGMPYMGLGRNMVYHRDLYHADQFQKSQSVPYGDDDLWINKVARKDNTTTVIAKESFVPSLPPLSWSSWFNQKKRHLSAGKYYSRRSKMTIGIFSACLVIEKILLLSIICIDIQLFLYLILLKYIVLFVAIYHNKRRIGMVNSVGSFWLYEYFHFIYLLVISPYIFFISKPNW